MASGQKQYSHKVFVFENKGGGPDQFTSLKENLKKFGQQGYRVAPALRDGDTRTIPIMEKEEFVTDAIDRLNLDQIDPALP